MDIANIEKVRDALRKLGNLKYCLMELDRCGDINQLHRISEEYGLNFKLPPIDEMKTDLINQAEAMVNEVHESMKDL